MLYKILLPATLSIFILGCGGSGSGSESESESDLTTVLEGEWLKSCGPADPDDQDTHYDTVRVTFTNNNFASSILNYTDSECLIPLSFSSNPTASGVFSIGDNITASGGMLATKIDSNITEFNGAPFTIDTFNIFYIQSGTKYLGDRDGVYDASTPELRPIALNFNRPFIKQ